MLGSYSPTRSAAVAESLVTVAFAIQLTSGVALLLAAGVSAYEVQLISGAGGSISGAGGFEALFVVIGVITLILLVVAYAYCYAPTRDGNFDAAVAPSLILGIIFVVLLVTVLIGVLYLFAHSRLDTASTELHLREESRTNQGSESEYPPTVAAQVQWTKCPHCLLPVQATDTECRRCGTTLKNSDEGGVSQG
jgi:hypothetical protein